eukprot:GHRQ01034025.1.p2 GENE.GHRQ01034025.1~~GHRQ01034025.1.p2  ORF type:complete len:216 (+),score=90.02 GHRQ01034025.1:958-1605(+)
MIRPTATLLVDGERHRLCTLMCMVDESYRIVYKPIMAKVRRGVVVLHVQCTPATKCLHSLRAAACKDCFSGHAAVGRSVPWCWGFAAAAERTAAAAAAAGGVLLPLCAQVMEMYQPEAIVVCSGADSLSGDKLGCFNLSLQGHSNCVEFLAKYKVPLLVVGGGGYTLRNVARCWAYETGRLMGHDLPDNLPDSVLNSFNYYMDNQRLRIEVNASG